MNRRKAFMLSVLGGTTLVVWALIAILLLTRPQWCCGPEVPVYPGATQVQSSVEGIFDKEMNNLRTVHYFTTASADQVKAFYRKTLEARGYSYNECCNLRYGGAGLYMMAGIQGLGGDLEVTWSGVAGGLVVEASFTDFRALACDCI